MKQKSFQMNGEENQIFVKNLLLVIQESHEYKGPQQKKTENIALLSQLEIKKDDETLRDNKWISVIKEELNQFLKNKVWTFVHQKYLYHFNKMDKKNE